MSFLLDTDICSAHFKGRRRVSARIAQHDGRVQMSAVTLGELFTWALRRAAPRSRLEAIVRFHSAAPSIAVDGQVARQFGELRAGLLDAGRPISTADLLIAATAITHDLILVTHNVSDFYRIPGLRIDDWLDPAG